MRRTSPCTRIISGNPADRCRSDALFLTEKCQQLSDVHGVWPRGRKWSRRLWRLHFLASHPAPHRGRMLRFQRDPAHEVTLLPVSKTFPAEALRRGLRGSAPAAARTCAGGARQDRSLIDLRPQLQWHLIGPRSPTRPAPWRSTSTGCTASIACALPSACPPSGRPSCRRQCLHPGQRQRQGRQRRVAPEETAALAQAVPPCPACGCEA